MRKKTLFEILVKNSTESVRSMQEMERSIKGISDISAKTSGLNEKMAKSLSDASREMGKLRSEAERTEIHTEKISRSFHTMGQVLAGLRLGIGAMIGAAGVNSVGKIVSKAMTVSGAGSVYGATMGQSGFSPVGKSDEFQQLKMQLVSATRNYDVAAKYFEKAKKEAADTPFDLKQVVGLTIGAANNLINPFQSFTKTKDSKYNLLRALGDIASSKGKSMNDARFSFLDKYIATGSTTSMQGRMNVSEGMLRNISQTQGEKFDNTTRQGRARAVQAYAEGTSGGGMERQTNTIGGKLSNMGDLWDQFLDMVGRSGPYKSALDWLTKIESKVNKMMEGGDNSKLAHFAESIGTFITGVADKVRKVFDYVFKDFDPDQSFGKNLKKIMSNAAEAIMDWLKENTPMMVGVMAGVFETALNMAFSAFKGVMFGGGKSSGGGVFGSSPNTSNANSSEGGSGSASTDSVPASNVSGNSGGTNNSPAQTVKNNLIQTAGFSGGGYSGGGGSRINNASTLGTGAVSGGLLGTAKGGIVGGVLGVMGGSLADKDGYGDAMALGLGGFGLARKFGGAGNHLIDSYHISRAKGAGRIGAALKTGGLRVGAGKAAAGATGLGLATAGITVAAAGGLVAGTMADKYFFAPRDKKQQLAARKKEKENADKGEDFRSAMFDGSGRERLRQLKRRGYTNKQLQDNGILRDASILKGGKEINVMAAQKLLHQDTQNKQFTELNSTPQGKKVLALREKEFQLKKVQKKDTEERASVDALGEDIAGGKYTGRERGGKLREFEARNADLLKKGLPSKSEFTKELGTREFNEAIQPMVEKLEAIITELQGVNDNISKLQMKKFSIDDKADSRALKFAKKMGMSPTDAYKHQARHVGKQVGEYEQRIRKRGGIENLSQNERNDYRSLLQKQEDLSLDTINSNPFQRDAVNVSKDSRFKTAGGAEMKLRQLDSLDRDKADLDTNDELQKRGILQKEQVKRKKALNDTTEDLTGSKTGPLQQYAQAQLTRTGKQLPGTLQFSKGVAPVLGGEKYVTDPTTGKAVSRSTAIQKQFKESVEGGAQLISSSNKELVVVQKELATAMKELNATLKSNKDKSPAVVPKKKDYNPPAPHENYDFQDSLFGFGNV